MGVSKVDFAGNTLVDLTGDSVTPETLLEGATAHNAAGELIAGAMKKGAELKIIVSVTSGATVTATKGSKVVSGTSVNGTCTLTVPEAGTWSVKATLGGKTSDTKNVSVVDSYAVALTFFSATITVTVESGASVVLKKNGTTLQTKTSTGTAVFTVTETGTYTVEATKSGQTVSGTVNVVSGTTSYSLTLSFVSAVLNDNDWATIKAVSDKDEGANYWSVGDCKEITLNGTVGALTLSNYTTYAFIIGFNHNQELEGANCIHFQLAKTALSGGTDVALCDSHYNSSGSSAGFRMNTSGTNSGGWKACYKRKTLYGNDGTPTSPLANSLMAALPSDLRAVMQPVTKYTDNTGNGSGNVQSNVTTTTDYLFDLSEFEVFGIGYNNANRFEQTYQLQYDYYKAGNTKIANNHTAVTTAVWWFLRSPYCYENNLFVIVWTDGDDKNTRANISSGLRPGFCV